MDLKKNFIRNTGFGLVSKLVQMIVGFLLISYVITSVGVKNWGILTLSISVVSLLSIVQSGISGGTSKRLSDSYYINDYNGFNKYYSGTLLIIYFLVFVIGLILFLYSKYFLQNIINDDTEIQTVRYVFYLTAITTLLQIIKLPFIAILQALNRVDIIANVITFGFLLRTILVLTLFVFNRSIVVYCLILAIEFCFHLLVTYYYARKNTSKFLRIKFKDIQFSYLLEILKFNLYNFINSLNYVFFIQLPALVVASRYGLIFSGYYGIGVQLNNLLRGFINILSNAIRPVFNILKSQEKINDLLKYFMLSNKLFLIVGGGIVIMSTAFLEDFLIIWLGEANTDLLVFCKYFLIFTAIGIISVPSAIMIITYEKLKFTSYFGLFLSVVGALIMYYLDCPVNCFAFIPVLLSILFSIYNINRIAVIFKLLKINYKVVLQLMLYICIIISCIILYESNFNTLGYKVLLVFIYTLSSFTILKKSDFYNLKLFLIKR